MLALAETYQAYNPADETFCDNRTPAKIIAGVKLAEQYVRRAYDSQDDGIIVVAEQRLQDKELDALAERFARENPFVN